jgi:hypothetical protein
MNSRTGYLLILLLAAVGLGFACHSGESHDPDTDHDEKNATTKAGEEEHEKSGRAHVSRTQQGNALVAIDEETQKRMGLEFHALEKTSQTPTIRAFGRLEQDPSAAFAIRAPLAGFLIANPETPWPELGGLVNQGSIIGHVRPRLGPVELFDLSIRLRQARAEVEEVAADLSVSRASYENKRQLNQKEKVVSDRTLEEAEAKVKSSEARLQAAKETMQLLEDAVGNHKGISTAIPLTVERAGQVIQVEGQPGEAVESGQNILRIADQTHMIARVEVAGTSSQNPTSDPIKATVAVCGAEDKPITARVLGSIAATDVITSGRAFLLALIDESSVIRPGLPVTAFLEMPGETAVGVLVPRSALLRYAGSAWVYRKSGGQQFERVALTDFQPGEKGWFTRSLTEKDEIVTTGAASLLSEELKSQIEAEEEGGE